MRHTLPALLATFTLLAAAACVPPLPTSKLEETPPGGTGGVSAGAGTTGAAAAGARAGTTGSGNAAATAGTTAGASGKAGRGGSMAVVGAGGTAGMAPPPYVVLAEDVGNPLNMAVDGNFVYWANAGARALMRVPVGGGTPSPIAPLTSRNAWVALDGATIFWSDGPTGIATQIFKANVDGSSLTLVISNNSGAVNQIAANGAGVFWTMTDGRVIAVPRSGNGPMILASSSSNPTAITVDTSNVYWVTADGTVMKVPMTGGSPLTIGTWPPPDPLNPGTPYQPLPNIAADAKNVYWGKLNGPIMEVGLGGGSPTFAFAFGTSRMFASMAVDTQAVYGGDPLGIVHYRRFASPDVEWTVGETGSPVTAIATDPANVYWTVGGLVSRIFKAPR